MTKRTLKVNINDTIRVKLKPKGLEILRREHDILRRLYPSLDEWKSPIEKDGYWHVQMWVFIQQFGSCISLGSELPFETNFQLETDTQDG